MKMILSKLKPQTLAVGSLFLVMFLCEIYLSIQRSSLQNQNAQWVKKTRELKNRADRTQRHALQLFRGVRNSDRALDRQKDALTSLQNDLDKSRFEIDSIKEEKSYLEEMVLNKT